MATSNQNINLAELCPEKQGLKRDMLPRHLLMISVGGTIGTGLFVGSGQTIHQAGPFGSILAYLAGGLVMCFSASVPYRAYGKHARFRLIPKLCYPFYFTRRRLHDRMALLD